MIRRLVVLVGACLLFACSREAPAGAGTESATAASALPSPSGSASLGDDAEAQEAKPPETADAWFERTLRASDPQLSAWLDQAESLRLQIVVTEVRPGTAPWPSYGFRVDAEYFYPASAIKTLLAVAALRTMNARGGEDIHPLTLIRRCRQGRPGCEPPSADEEEKKEGEESHDSEDEKPKHKKLRVGEELHKLLAYSDNDSYNRFWDIVGQREINEDVQALGLSSVRFHHRMDAPADRSRRTLRVALLPPGKAALVSKARQSDYQLPPTPAKRLLVGEAYNDGKLHQEPMSFAEKNYIPLGDLQRVQLSLLFPDRPEAAKLGLSEAQRGILIKAMTARLTSAGHAAVHHPFSPGALEVLPAERLRLVGKSGRAYGFHIDNAYIEDIESKRAFFLTATVYANPNGVLNDDDYGYKETSGPLLAAIGKAVTQALLVDEPRDWPR